MLVSCGHSLLMLDVLVYGSVSSSSQLYTPLLIMLLLAYPDYMGQSSGGLNLSCCSVIERLTLIKENTSLAVVCVLLKSLLKTTSLSDLTIYISVVSGHFDIDCWTRIHKQLCDRSKYRVLKHVLVMLYV